jgi:D-alanyl-lipoteichoic acid acyltransferase DltB (MBOAT superfamily)
VLFNSFVFVIFFIVVLIVSGLLPHRPRLYFLLVASYFFYGYWRWDYTGLLLLSTLIDYFVALAMGRTGNPGKRKILLTISMVSNLGLLGVFKYYNFFVSSVSSWFGQSAIPLDVLLPVGISFYTFQSMSYTIDVYRGVLEPRKSFVDFALFVSFFPQLVAGPIVRAVDFLPQLYRKPPFNKVQFRSGLHLILRGFIEKVIIADNLAPVVERVYANPANFTMGDLWVATYCFAFQIFCDFAGYTDIARGCAKLLGYEFLENFHRPYLAMNISDFWRRWHISLSTWLRDYLYISLGGSRKGKWKTYRNLFLTMLLGGIWHGANWTFLWWGIFHGVLLIIYHLFNEWRKSNDREQSPQRRRLSIASKMVSIFLTFHAVCAGWVLFRASDIDSAKHMLKRMFIEMDFTTQFAPYLWLCSLLYAAMAIDEYLKPGQYFERSPLAVRTLILAAALIALAVFVPTEQVAFLYFQF